ncbi:MAG: hypothetical protein OEZ14_08330 [Acidimicrobiia bacterium]|nr:hypothetical protein [Acidimicrobiia bacterium]
MVGFDRHVLTPGELLHDRLGQFLPHDEVDQRRGGGLATVLAAPHHQVGQRLPLPLGRSASHTKFSVFTKQFLRFHIEESSEGLAGEWVEREPAGDRAVRMLAIGACRFRSFLIRLAPIRIRGIQPVDHHVHEVGEVTVASSRHKHPLRLDQLVMHPVIVELVQLPNMTFGQLAGGKGFGEHGEIDQPVPNPRQPAERPRIGLRGIGHKIDGVTEPKRPERTRTLYGIRGGG